MMSKFLKVTVSLMVFFLSLNGTWGASPIVTLVDCQTVFKDLLNDKKASLPESNFRAVYSDVVKAEYFNRDGKPDRNFTEVIPLQMTNVWWEEVPLALERRYYDRQNIRYEIWTINTSHTADAMKPTQLDMDNNLKIFQSVVAENVDFATNHYKRRTWFSPSLTEKFQKLAKDFAFQSSYIFARDLSTGRLLGSLRLVSAPYQLIRRDRDGAIKTVTTDWLEMPRTDKEFEAIKEDAILLPMESALSIRLPHLPMTSWHGARNGFSKSMGWLVEPGNFAIAKGSHQVETMVSLMTEMVETLNSLAHRGYYFKFREFIVSVPKIKMYTYGDKVSEVLYKPMGFENSSKFKGSLYIGNEPTAWNILESEVQKLAEAVEKLNERRAGVSQKRAQDLRAQIASALKFFLK